MSTVVSLGDEEALEGLDGLEHVVPLRRQLLRLGRVPLPHRLRHLCLRV